MPNPTARDIIATSHDGRYEYYECDRYIFQRDTRENRECGWLCALSAWESVFCHSPQFAIQRRIER